MTITERYAVVKNTLESNGLLEPSTLVPVIEALIQKFGLIAVVKVIDLEDVWLYFRENGKTWCKGEKAEIVTIAEHQMRRSLQDTRLLQINERGLPTTLLTW